ncbi:hypothetical protein LY90DRAFT_502721 [Neocallimastix californiae]|uniref:Uncharacterized protein n=1 Tax=Neocallimastix californiae TaxID=1754190 RepID=A0A1Y2ETP6_9FUNG|nr:hypothetical protein LY90DRAFT_502721 [Neocallimastix californiae]|eukprot:ORY74215.1 hypothetical protein LY90DRAFT_502721 [Neocallimastix californiae]
MFKQKNADDTAAMENALSLFNKEIEEKGSVLNNELVTLKDLHKANFDMIQSVIGTGIAHKDDLLNFANIKNLDDINKRWIEYYQKIEVAKDTLIKVSKDNGKDQREALEALINKESVTVSKNLSEAISSAVVNSKLPEKLAITTALNKEDKELVYKTINCVNELASQFALTLAAMQQVVEQQKTESNNDRSAMIQAISSCSELMNFFKDFTKDNYIFFGNKQYLITRYPKTAILFDITSTNGIITSIEMKDKFKEKTTKILEYIFRNYNMDSDLSTIQSMNTTEAKKPAADAMNVDPPPPRNGILKNPSNGSHDVSSSSSTSFNLKTFLNTQANAANSAKNFPNRSLYREYKVIESNIEEWTKNTVNNLTASNNVVSFQIPYAISFSNSSSDKANDPATFQRIFNEADDFVYQFYEFLHFFAHPPNEESLASAFISCLPSHQQSYFLKTYYLPSRGVNPNRITIPFEEILAHFQSKFATYTLEEAQKLWDNLKLDKENLDIFETRVNKIAKILKKSDYAKGLKVYSILPKKWQEEAIKKNISFATFSDDNFDPIMRFINKMALEERVIKNQRESYLSLNGPRSTNK